MEREIINFLALGSIKGVGFESLRRLAEKGINFSDVIASSSTEEVSLLLRSAGARLSSDSGVPWSETRDRALGRAQEISDRLLAIGATILFRSNDAYPSQLLDLPDAPHWLFVQGNVEILSKASVAVVGSREPTDEGLWLARYVGFHLRDWSCPTVSGLALGIDQEIHIASLRCGVPTIAFLGTGIFSDYPRNSERLRHDIVRLGGAVVTEYLPNETYSAKNFVKRNRLQAALANALIPVEWSLKSGTAHTVRYAASLERPIACLRLPFGKSPDWLQSDIAKKASTFVVPQQAQEFSQFIQRGLSVNLRREVRQLSLF